MRLMRRLWLMLFGGPEVKSTDFSDFIRNASAREKKRVYTEVLIKATEQQNATHKSDRHKLVA